MWQRLLLLLAVIFSFFAGGFEACAQSTSWPVAVPMAAGSAQIYRPQLDSYDGSQIKGRAAVSFLGANSAAPVFGAIWFQAQVLTDLDDRTATLCNFAVTNIKFPAGAESVASAVQVALTSQAANWRPVIPLETLTGATKQARQRIAETQQINGQAPTILFASQPTVLVTIEGEPKLMRVENTPLIRVANTPFCILLDPVAKIYYLKGGASWYTSAAATGPFAPAVSLPPAVAAAAPSSATPTTTPPPAIIVASQPTELLVTDGPEQFGTIPGTNLLYVSNTEDDIFIEIVSQQVFLLLSGRWFSAPNQSGPWTYVLPSALPVDFAMIPLDSPKADVLTSVAGTPQNTVALTDYQIPQTAAIKNTARIATVPYDGQPEFRIVQGTEIEYAVNTSYDIVKAEGRYYCCDEAVWYASDTALGPFLVTATIPDAIYLIPPGNPLYRDTFVRPFYSDVNSIWFGYYPGYVGSYLWNGSVVWGTGWGYPAWFGKVYIPRPATWGFGARYNPVNGHWGFHIAATGSRGWIDISKSSWGSGLHGWWGAGGYSEHSRGIVTGTKVTRTNIYAKDSSRLAIDPRRDAIVNQNTQVKTTDRGVQVDRDTHIITDTGGNVYRRQLTGYHRYDGDAGWSHVSDPGVTRDLDRQFSVSNNAFDRHASFEGRRR